MPKHRLSVLIPTRERAHTLRFALQTCLAQEFQDCEILVSDNASSPATREVVESWADRRIRYVRTPKLLAMSDSWEFAVGQASGEYLMLIGDDDGLLLHALPEIDRLIRLLDTKLLRWESVCYNWPDLPAQPHAAPHELLIPLGQVDYYYPIHRRDGRAMIQAAADSDISYAQLPSIYCSAVHHSLIAGLRTRVGRVFRSPSPDVYSSFALAHLAGTYHSVAAPMNINGLSGRSNGVACLYLKGRSPIAEEFRRLNAQAEHAVHWQIPDLPVMPALVADSFQQAKEGLFANESSLLLDRKKLVVNCLQAVTVEDEAEWERVVETVRRALGDDRRLSAWFEAEYGTRRPESFPRIPPRPLLKRYGGTYLHLDAAEFGVSDVWGVAQLCERILGCRRDGVNAHVAPASGPAGSMGATRSPGPVAPPAEASARPRPPSGRAWRGWLERPRPDGLGVMAVDLHEQGLDLRVLLELYARVENRSVIDVGAERGSFVEAFLQAGCPRLYAFEPYPPHARHLRERFGANPAVTVLEMALGSRDETAILHIAEDRRGSEYDYYHSLVKFEETREVRWNRQLPVECRTLGSLVETGVLPAEVGVLKIDTEGNDYEVLLGMGRLFSPVVMVEYWDELPEILGKPAYSLTDVAGTLRGRGYSNVAIIKRHDEFQVVQVGSLTTRPGDWGNAVFIHDSVFSRLAPVVYQAAAVTQTELIDKALEFRSQSHKRLDVIAELREALERELAQSQGVQAQPPSPPPLSRMGRAGRLRGFLTPRLGSLWHYPPRPLVIPAHYGRTRSPASPPVISIVTPSLNQGAFLERTIKSVVDQDYPRLEYIVQDGGSSDETIGILDRYRGSLHHCESVRDGGQANAINLGFRHATGEIMGYLNSDDVLLPGALDYVAGYFAAHPEVDVVYSHRVVIDENDGEIGRWVLPPHDDQVLLWADYVPQETLFWRRRIWEKVGGAMDESFQFALDWDLLLRYRSVGARFMRVPRFLAAFRVHPEQKTSAQMTERGAQEMNELRQRCHGRAVSREEISNRVRPYLRRHVVFQKLYRLGVLWH